MTELARPRWKVITEFVLWVIAVIVLTWKVGDGFNDLRDGGAAMPDLIYYAVIFVVGVWAVSHLQKVWKEL